ncbi:MAG: metalloendopeptidase, partial [bacterium]|nr:metalloendopeptidase [bacterium]
MFTTMVLTACAFGASGDAIRVLPDEIGGVAPSGMVRAYLVDEMAALWETWQAEYEARTSPEAIAEYQAQMRERFVEALGGFPERTPLNAQVTGVVRRKGYRVEKVLFESQPGLYVTGALFVPESDRFKGPYPGVLVPCGHSVNGKAHEPYQTMGAFLALEGNVALVFDPVDQGERYQVLKDDGTMAFWGTYAHTMAGIGSILVGRNTATYEIWDGMRGIDYLQSRPEVVADRIGCTGNSGGGTQTSFLMALDDRVDVAAPSCYLNRLGRQMVASTGDAEQNIAGQLGFGMDHADYLMMRAPIPIKIL